MAIKYIDVISEYFQESCHSPLCRRVIENTGPTVHKTASSGKHHDATDLGDHIVRRPRQPNHIRNSGDECLPGVMEAWHWQRHSLVPGQCVVLSIGMTIGSSGGASPLGRLLYGGSSLRSSIPLAISPASSMNSRCQLHTASHHHLLLDPLP